MKLYILFTFLTLLVVSAEGKKHVMSGKITVKDRVENVQGVRDIFTEADLLMPIVPWEDLSADDVTIVSCRPLHIRFVGMVEEEDFKEGNVLTFPKDDYLDMGCPQPPVTDELSVLDEVIFRKITFVKFLEDGVRVKTEFISGADVAPHVAVHVGQLVSPASRIIESGRSVLEMKTVARVDDIGITAFDENGSIDVVSGVQLDWGIKATAGVCEFDFDRFPPKATWEQRVRVEATASVTAAIAFETADSGELLNIPIIGAAFTKKIFLVGKIGFGLFASVDYDISLKSSASAKASFSGVYETGQKVKVSLGGFDSESLASSGESGVGDLVFTGPTVEGDLTVKGFAGLRPAISAELSLPLIGDASAEVCATVGLQLDANFQDPPFSPVSDGGLTIGSCDSCHFVQGTLDLIGKDFTVEGEVPVLGKESIVIADQFLDVNLGTLCAFSTTCPNTAEPTTMPTTTVPSLTEPRGGLPATTVSVTTTVATTGAATTISATTVGTPPVSGTTAATTVAATTTIASSPGTELPSTTATTEAPVTTAAATVPATTVATTTTGTGGAPITTVAVTTAPPVTTIAVTTAATTAAVTTASTVATTTMATTLATTAAPTTAAATTTMGTFSCAAHGVPGMCLPTGECAGQGHLSQPGLCPGPTDIQCCVPNFGSCFSMASSRSGTCKDSCASGMTEVGLCPGDASVTCCFDNE